MQEQWSNNEKNIGKIYTPDVYFESGFKDKNKHLALVEKVSINPEAVIPEIKDEIKSVIEKSKVLFFGIDHASCISHRKIAEFISDLPKDKKVNLFVEYSPAIQENIDMFIKTGKFSNSDDSSLYNKIYNYVENGGLSIELPENLQGTFFDSCPSLIDIFPILIKAKELGVNVVAGDEYHDSSMEDDDDLLKRDEGMFHKLQNSVDRFDTTIVIVGGNHSLNDDYELEVGSYLHKTKEKVSSLAKISKKYWGESEVKNFWLENQLHLKKYADDNQVVSSVLFDTMKKFHNKGENTGLKIEEGSIKNSNDIMKFIKTDYYVPVYE